MTALPSDYDSDPGRYLASTEGPHDDVHPYVAAQLADAGARTVLDVGGGTGKLARLLPGLSMRCLLIDLSVTMLALAPRPAVRADGSRLPIAGASVDAVAALYTLYHYGDPRVPIAEASVRRSGRRRGSRAVGRAARHSRGRRPRRRVPAQPRHEQQDARLAAATLDLPLTLTMRGCFVYATKAPGAAEAASPSSRSTG